ncbi:MAG: hypothetical protein FWF41_08605 [Betaproteobacteria bacterium]|nr:hypothetical protein [Betaproteobacteria bacterium]
MIMNWSPITVSDLELIIAQEVAFWPADLLGAFEKNRVLKKVLCKRSDSYGLESIFVIAEIDDSFIVYDDVEEEFCVAQKSSISNRVLGNWDAFIDLKSAFQRCKKSIVSSKGCSTRPFNKRK